MEDIGFNILMVIFFAVAAVMIIRWRINWHNSFQNKQTMQMMKYARQKAENDKKDKEDKEQRRRAYTFFVNSKGEARRGDC